MQPLIELQKSSVQPLASSQFGATPPRQEPAAQVSAVVQALPSSHASTLSPFTQPIATSQLSSVHKLPSSQSTTEVSTPSQAPAAHTSPVVQAFPSSQPKVLFALRQSETASQESEVQRFPSSQLPSLTALTITSFTSSQESSVQPTPSSATGSVLSWQSRVASQLSTPVQNSVSSQSASLTALTITSLASSQESSVQPTPSSASGSALSWQPRVASQVSTPVQNSVSSQSASLTALTITLLTSSQESSVQGTPSSAFGSALSWQPSTASQLSTPVQNWPSSQAPWLVVLTSELVASSQVSTVQTTPSLGSGSMLSWQPSRASQLSTPVQYKLSSQLPWLIALTITSLISSQLSSVQPTPSSATGSALSWQSRIASQVSTPVQNCPSAQRPSLTALTITSLISSQLSLVQPTPSSATGSALSTQPNTESQLSIPVQKNPSSQTGATPPTQVPAAQVSVVVQASPSSQAATVKLATGQVAPRPSQTLLSVHTSWSVHAVAAATRPQLDVQQSPSRVLPSSHCSP